MQFLEREIFIINLIRLLYCRITRKKLIVCVHDLLVDHPFLLSRFCKLVPPALVRKDLSFCKKLLSLGLLYVGMTSLVYLLELMEGSECQSSSWHMQGVSI